MAFIGPVGHFWLVIFSDFTKITLMVNLKCRIYSVISSYLDMVVLKVAVDNLPMYCSCRYEGLDRFLKVKLQYQPKSIRFVATKVALDGIIFRLVDLFIFFTYMGFASGKTFNQVKDDVKRDFLPALVLEGGIWQIVQVANFRFIPVKYQLLYVNSFCLLDSCFLSWLEQQQDAAWKQWFKILSSNEHKNKED
ncbi:hypothetical protein HanOQP8_Chr10g0358741 [Helianthus annuus]|nr:hypothetical protein HanOQP8_Chr10g0358741 [Helianthus annuus]KAJ0883033.1 hypothetical protein HanPSC8_Chr10g0416671 [Helianthus annuus]